MSRYAVRSSRMLTAGATLLALLAFGVASASATTGTTTANGFQVAASLSPDVAQKNQTVTETAAVRNVSDKIENVRVTLAGPAPTGAPIAFAASLQPGASISKSLSFPAGIVKPGTAMLTVTAQNLQTGETAQASASITVN